MVWRIVEEVLALPLELKEFYQSVGYGFMFDIVDDSIGRFLDPIEFKKINLRVLWTIVTILGYSLLSSLCLLNRQGGADILFYFLINVSFILHFVYLVVKLIVFLFKKKEGWRYLLVSILLVLLGFSYSVYFFENGLLYK